MEEVSNQGSEEKEIAAPETEADSAEARTEASENAEVQTEQKDPEWAKRLRKEREETIRKNRELESQVEMQRQLIHEISQGRNAAPQKESQADPVNVLEILKNKEYVEGAEVATALENIQKQNKKELEALRDQMRTKALQERLGSLRSKYSDFDEVVNVDTLKLVKKTNPDLADQWRNLDDYSIAVQAYPYIKYSGLLEDSTSSKRSKEVEKRLEANKKTLPAAQTFDKRPMAMAYREPQTKEEKQALLKEMNYYASMTGGQY